MVTDFSLGWSRSQVCGCPFYFQYARSVQSRFQTTGHLFERRYHAVLVDADNYLLELLRYIHLNPVRAGITPSPMDYPWSSHRVYLGTRNEAWVTTEFALSLFHSDLHTAVTAYQQFVEATSLQLSSSPLIHCNPNDPRILGDDSFLASLTSKGWQPKSTKTVEQLVEEACTLFAVTRTALSSPCRQRHLTFARAWIAHQAVTLNISSLAQVARLFNRNEASLRQSVKANFNYP